MSQSTTGSSTKPTFRRRRAMSHQMRMLSSRLSNLTANSIPGENQLLRSSLNSTLSRPNSTATFTFMSRLSSRLSTVSAASSVGFSSSASFVMIVSLVRTRQVFISICSVLISSSGVSFRSGSPVRGCTVRLSPPATLRPPFSFSWTSSAPTFSLTMGSSTYRQLLKSSAALLSSFFHAANLSSSGTSAAKVVTDLASVSFSFMACSGRQRVDPMRHV
mmetsp:Transcript_28860/g.73184  ORF Transcript_28860/g.73184 Transcript_28860/m.73184 type:complete len:218 (-) Transcript_28860:42-695(-)